MQLSSSSILDMKINCYLFFWLTINCSFFIVVVTLAATVTVAPAFPFDLPSRVPLSSRMGCRTSFQRLGMQECKEGFVPLQTVLPTEHLLWVVRCNCPTDYSTLRCLCKKHNSECTPSCRVLATPTYLMIMILTHLSSHTL